MRVVPFASILALALAGAACSETTAAAPAVETPPAEAELTPTSAPADDGFNLMMPGDDTGTTTSSDGFNLATPALGDAPNSDGFNLPSDLPSTSALESIPEIDTSILDDEAAPENTDEDEVIRLDP